MRKQEQIQQGQPAEWTPRQLTLGARMGKDFRINWQLYAMFIFPVIYYIIFRYIPMFGNILAFRKYYAGGNIFGEGPLTLKYFKQFITAKPFWDAFKNTLILNGLYLLFRFPLTLIFALLLNEIRNLNWKKFVQTVSYLPHFISMVIVCGMIKELLSTSGPVNDIIQQFGGEKINFIALAEWFRTIFVASGVWQSLGWGTILYLAAMSGINPSLYEAATVDGANHFQQVIHVTIPCILPTIATLLILDIGGLVGSGGAFEKVYLLYSPLTYETSDIVSTYAGAFSFSSDDQSGFWGPIGIEYFYHVSPVVGVGAVASIAGCKYDHSSFKANYYTVMPAVKFNWLRRDHFGLYSELAAGMIIMQTKVDGTNHSDAKEESTTDFMWQATALGVEFGSAFRGFCELGFGEKGILCAGMRYKF